MYIQKTEPPTKDHPVFTAKAREQIRDFADRIQSHAIEWALLLAKRDGSDMVTEKHTAEVERIMAKFPRTERLHPEMETAIGGFVFGLSLAMPDLLGALFPINWQWTHAVTFWSVTLLMITGAALAVHGWIRAR